MRESSFLFAEILRHVDSIAMAEERMIFLAGITARGQRMLDTM